LIQREKINPNRAISAVEDHTEKRRGEGGGKKLDKREGRYKEEGREKWQGKPKKRN